MAFYPGQEEEDELKKAESAETQLGTPSAAASGGGPASQLASGAPTPHPKMGSGRFFDFSRFLNANKGAGAEMAKGVTNRVAGQAQGAQQAITGLQNELMAPMETSMRSAKGAAAPVSGGGKTPTPTSNTADAIKAQMQSSPMMAMFGGDNSKFDNWWASQATPENLAAMQPYVNLPGPSQETVDRATRDSTATYTGPRSLVDMPGFADVAQRGSAAVGAVNALGTSGGRAALLGAGQHAGYTGGLSKLDSLLMGAEGGGQLKATQKQFSGLRKLMEDTVKNSESAGRIGDDLAAQRRAAGQAVLEESERIKQHNQNAETARTDRADQQNREIDSLQGFATTNFMNPVFMQRLQQAGATPPGFNGFNGDNDKMRAWVAANMDAVRKVSSEMGWKL
jgi:polyhydroxyalkanoate synthesis regulator phasin